MRPQSTQGEIERLESEMQTIKLRRAGYTIPQIAEKLGTCEKTVFNRLKSAMDRVRAEIKIDAQMHIETELDKLEQLESRLHRAIELEPPNNELAQLADKVVKISESRRKLLGLDAPQEVRHSGPLYTVKSASPDTEAWPDAPTQAPVHEDKVQVEVGSTKEHARWEDVAEAALARAGFSVIDRAGTYDYQGWGVLLGKSGDEFAVVSWSYGSHGGCDNFEDLSDEDRAAEFDGMVARGMTEQEARLKFDSSKGW